MLVSFTMQGWEGISLAYITLSPPSPPLTSPSPPPTHTLSPLSSEITRCGVGLFVIPVFRISSFVL